MPATSPVRFRSKVDWWFVVVSLGFAAICATVAVPMLREGISFSGMVAVAALAFWAWLIASTSYVITEHQLLVRSGPVRRTLDLASIRAVRPTGSVLSAPALSMDRIEVVSDAGAVVISPADQSRFVREIAARAPAAVLEGFAP